MTRAALVLLLALAGFTLEGSAQLASASAGETNAPGPRIKFAEPVFDFGRVKSGMGNNGTDGTEGAVTGNVFGSYLHGPVLPANPALADALIKLAVERALGQAFVPGHIDDELADKARMRQVRRLVG